MKSCHDVQIVCEFRDKLRLAEEMISKLAFSLHEIQAMKTPIQIEAEKSGLRSQSRLIRPSAQISELIRR